MRENNRFNLQTAVTHDERDSFYGEVVPPVFMSTLFTYRNFDDFQRMQRDQSGYYYSRMGNPTLQVLETQLARLENGEAAKVFASGMAAVSVALLHLLKQGDHVVCQYPIYGGTHKLLRQYLPKFGVSVDFVDFKDVEEVRAAIRPNTKVLMCESISTFLMEVFDVAAIVGLAKEFGLYTVMDNTCATPANFRPLDWGIDIVVHSASKYFGGHSDVIAGAVIASRKFIEGMIDLELSLLGSALGPFEAWLVGRGLRTFPLRIREQGRSALEIAKLLAETPRVTAVHYPLLPGHPQFELASRQLDGPSGLLSFEMEGGTEAIAGMIDRLRLFQIGVSWGGFESLVYAPCMSPGADADTPSGKRMRSLVRLSVGLENTDDLLNDLQQAFGEG